MALPKVESPKFELTVPSTGKKVTYRPYLVKEEKILMLALESDDQNDMIQSIRDVIESCTFGELDQNSITMFDLEYVFIKLREKSVGETSEVRIECPHCTKQNDVTIDLSKANVNVPKDKSHYVRKITDDIHIKMAYPSVQKTLEITSKEQSDIETAYDVIFASIREIYHSDEVYDISDHTDQELVEFIESLNSTQFESIKDFVESVPSAVIPYQYFCSSCGYQEERTIDGLANFFG